MIKAKIIKVTSIENEEIMLVITMTKIITLKMTIIIIVRIRRIKIGNRIKV